MTLFFSTHQKPLPGRIAPLFRRRLAMLISGLCLTLSAAAATQSQRSARDIPQELYGGVVANETITSAGENFYQCFVAAWREHDLSERYAISIHERPSARWGGTIWIEYAQRRIFQSALPPARAAIKELSSKAAELVYVKVIDAEVERLLFRDADLGADEI